MDNVGHCEQHPKARIVGKCVNCGKPVCMECFAARGYLCSDSCRDAVRSRAPAPAQAASAIGQEKMEQVTRWTDLAAKMLFKVLPLTIVALVLLVLGVRAMDGSGKELWVMTAPDEVGFTATALAGDALYLLRSDGLCQAVGAADGAEKWQATLREEPAGESAWPTEFFWSTDTLTVTNGLLVCCGHSDVVVLDAADGKRLWRHALTGWGQKQFAFDGDHILLVDWRTGGEAGAPPPAAAATFEEMLRLREQNTPHVVCMDLRSGAELWARRYENRDIKELGIAGDTCYCVSCSPPHLVWRPCAKHKSSSVAVMSQCPQCAYDWAPASEYEINLMQAANGEALFSSRLASGAIDSVHLLPGGDVALATTENLYVLAAGGEKRAACRLPGKLWKAAAVGDVVVAAMEDGKLLALSTGDGSVRWESAIGGSAWDLQIAPDSIYVTAGIPEPKEPGSEDGDVEEPQPLTPQEKMMREFMGQSSADVPGPGERVHAALLNYGLATGKERWRDDSFAGAITALPGGHVQLVQGGDAALQFIDGTGAVLTEHLRRNGKPCWKYKVQERIDAMTIGPDTVFVITNPGSGIMGNWTTKVEKGSKIRAIRRRTFVNRLRKI